MADDKKIKAAIKEGGKKGVDLSGVAAMGGVSFFNISIENADGDLALLDKVLEGANAEVDESAEERKGGAGDIGKFFMSAGDKQLAMLCHLPKELAAAKNVSKQDWVDAVIKVLKGAEVVESTEEITKVVVPANADAGLFPLKMRDEAITAGVAFLREKGLLPADDSSDDDVNYAEAAGVEW